MKLSDNNNNNSNNNNNIVEDFINNNIFSEDNNYSYKAESDKPIKANQQSFNSKNKKEITPDNTFTWSEDDEYVKEEVEINYNNDNNNNNNNNIEILKKSNRKVFVVACSAKTGLGIEKYSTIKIIIYYYKRYHYYKYV